MEEFITPIIKATKGKEEISFYSLPEFEEWKKSKDNWPSYRVKYYKGIYFCVTCNFSTDLYSFPDESGKQFDTEEFPSCNGHGSMGYYSEIIPS